MSKKSMTIEDLAILVKKGFDHTVSKEEFRQELDGVREEFRKELGGIKTEIKELREHILRLAADISRLKEDMNRDGRAPAGHRRGRRIYAPVAQSRAPHFGGRHAAVVHDPRGSRAAPKEHLTHFKRRYERPLRLRMRGLFFISHLFYTIFSL